MDYAFWRSSKIQKINPENPHHPRNPGSAFRRVAQPGSALLWGSRGRGFKSRHADFRKIIEIYIRVSSRPEKLGYYRMNFWVVVNLKIKS